MCVRFSEMGKNVSFEDIDRTHHAHTLIEIDFSCSLLSSLPLITRLTEVSKTNGIPILFLLIVCTLIYWHYTDCIWVCACVCKSCHSYRDGYLWFIENLSINCSRSAYDGQATAYPTIWMDEIPFPWKYGDCAPLPFCTMIGRRA